MQPAALSREIKALAFALGFDEAGITTPAALEPAESALASWVAEGRHGTMVYLENFTARRREFYEKIPDARSVLVLGVNYLGPEPRPSPAALSGRLARYAWGRDYHETIREKHALLGERIRALAGPGFRCESCVDTSPLPERFAAAEAGLGFLGKHTGLISRRFGPWLFLSELVTNLELETDAPDAGDCGSCSLCQPACPTGALAREYRIDARLCIAYLTIEHKGVIPRELRPKIGDRIFGCDDCLRACPYSERAPETAWPEFRPEAGQGAWIDLEALFALGSNAEYEKKFASTAILRARRKQMLRNACVVLGNSGRPEAVGLLARALEDESALVRLHAAWALGRLGARGLLRGRLEKEEDAAVREEIRLSLV